MTVLDASVLVDALVVVGPPGNAARSALRLEHTLHVPAIFAAEVTSSLRSMLLRGDLSDLRARGALQQLHAVKTIEYPFRPFADRVWELRHNLTVYDAWYIALAERLGVTFVTADRRLLSASGPLCAIEQVTASGSSSS